MTDKKLLSSLVRGELPKVNTKFYGLKSGGILKRCKTKWESKTMYFPIKNLQGTHVSLEEADSHTKCDEQTDKLRDSLTADSRGGDKQTAPN